MRKVPYDTNKGQKKGRPLEGELPRELLEVSLILHEFFNSLNLFMHMKKENRIQIVRISLHRNYS